MGKKDKSEVEDLGLPGFEGFDEITKHIIPGTDSESGEDVFEPLSEAKDDDDEEEDVETKEEDKEPENNKNEKPQEDEEDSEDEFPEDAEKDDKKSVDDLDENELVEPFVDLFAEELGWDLDDENKPKNIEELVEFMSSVIESNSKPKYSSEVSQKFDEFVANGGDPKKFFDKVYGGLDTSKLDLKNEEHQKQIIRELYRRKGFSESKIEKNIQRISDMDELEEEAKDAYSEIEEMREAERESVVEEQRIAKEKEEKARMQFVETVESKINSTNDVYGIKISKKDKEELMKHVFEVGKDGKTQQQRDYAENPVEYLIITSFAYKNKDKIKSLLQGKVETSAVQKFKEKQRNLMAKGKHKSDAGEDYSREGQDWLNDFKI